MIIQFFILLGFCIGSPSASATTVEESIHIADKAFERRNSEKEANFAWETYQKLALDTKFEKPEILWRLAAASYFRGHRIVTNNEEKIRLFEQGRDAGLKAIALEPNCAACHFWTAVNMTLYGDTVGPMKILFSLGEIESHLKKTIALDETYAEGGGYRILGMIQQKLPGILGGSNERAREYFEKALKVAPNQPLNYQFLAQILKNEFHLESQSSAIAYKGYHLPPSLQESIESQEARETLKSLISKHEEKSPMKDIAAGTPRT